jgi:hypothetical protein
LLGGNERTTLVFFIEDPPLVPESTVKTSLVFYLQHKIS